MVEDEYDEVPKDEVSFCDLAPGFAIIDSGATRTLVGEEAYMAISSPEVSQPATTVLSARALPCSKLPNAVASLA